jgi:U1 zinc finger
MVSLEVYGIGILIFISLSMVYIYIFILKPDKKLNTLEVPSPSTQSSGRSSKKNPKKKSKSKANLHKIIPEGKTGYCKYCEVYLADDEFVETHVTGKKHLFNIQGIQGSWLEIVDATQVQVKTNKPSIRTKPAQISKPVVHTSKNDEDFDEELAMSYYLLSKKKNR